jgi:hypothetical protein
MGVSVPPQRVFYSAALFALCMTLIGVAKPRWLLTDSGRLKAFGLGSADRSVASLGPLSGVLAIASMLIFSMIDAVYG